MNMSPLPVGYEMRISKRTHLEIGALLVLIGFFVCVAAALRFEAFLVSDQRFRNEFEPYLITHQLKTPESSQENHKMFLHRKMVYDFYPSGNEYSRCGQMVVCGSGGMTVIALGSWICLRARRRRDP